MSGKQMEGNNTQRRHAARVARRNGKSPSETGATLGASKQPTEAQHGMTHQERVDLKKEGKVEHIDSRHLPRARPGSRDSESPEHEVYPRL